MLNSKLISLIDSFTKTEFREFKKFISSAFFSGGRNYLLLFNLILKYRNKNFENLNAKNLYSKLYPGKSFSSQTLSNRISELYKLGEDFLIFKSLKTNKTEKDRILLMSFYERKLSKLFQNQLTKSKNSLRNKKDGDLKFFDQVFLQRLGYAFSDEQIISEDTYTNYFEHSEFLTALFLKNIFEFGYEFLQQEQTNRHYDFNPSVEILKRMNIDDELINKLLKKDSVIFKTAAMEYFFYMNFKNPDQENYYFEAKKIFYELKDWLDSNYSFEIYKKLTNYCIMMQNAGIKKFQKELFSLYNERLNPGLSHNGKKLFTVTTFRNYVLIGIILKKFKWTEDFIKKYSHELPPENRSNEVRLSYSKLYFSNKNYEKSLDYLEGFKGLNYLHHCDSSILKLCSYYELNEYEQAFSDLDTFRHYLRNHREIEKIHKEYYMNFVKVFQMLIRIKTSANESGVFDVESLMDKIKLASRKKWLEEKIEEL